MKIGILGSTGFVGKNLCARLDELGISYVNGSRKLEFNEYVDAMFLSSIISWIVENKIDTIVNLSAHCGGIGLNKNHPFELWYNNTLMSANVLYACKKMNLKVIMVGTVCSYAAECPTPFKEEYLMNYGFPEPTNRAYGVTKLNSLVGAQALNKEYGINIVNLIPVNMYGPHDNFNLESSHVIPAIIKKLMIAKKLNHDHVSIWGDGNASREFLYVADFCDAIVKSLQINSSEFINVGTGVETKIKDLVYMINNHINYDGDIRWSSDLPNGQMKRCLDTTKAKVILNWNFRTNLKSGLKKTIDWLWRQDEIIF